MQQHVIFIARLLVVDRNNVCKACISPNEYSPYLNPVSKQGATRLNGSLFAPTTILPAFQIVLMCEIYNVCQTLSTGSEFFWCLNDDIYTVRKSIEGPNINTFSAEQYAAIHELIARQPGGTPLGASGTGEVPADSLGAWLERNGRTRPLASYLAAMAVAEGIFQYEDLGNGPGRGIKLFPVQDEPGRPEYWIDEDAELNPNIDAAAASTAERLRELAGRIESSPPPERKEYVLQLNELIATEQPAILADIKTWEGAAGTHRFIYRFTVENSSIANRLQTCISDAKSTANNKTKYSRINTPNGDSLCAYVGSSKSVTQRMKQHFGYAQPAVYSLHLKSWPNLPDNDVKIEILKYPSNIGQDVLQALEDDLWQSSKPMFGKQGAR